MLFFLLLFFYLVTWWEQSQPLFLILWLGLTTGTGSRELSYLIKKKEVSNIRNHCLLAACFIIELRKLDFCHLWIYWSWECAKTGVYYYCCTSHQQYTDIYWHERPALQSVAVHAVNWLWHYWSLFSFLFFLVVYFSRKKGAWNKKLILRKLKGAKKNIGEESFWSPPPVANLDLAVGGMLQALRRCRQRVSASDPGRLEFVFLEGRAPL